MVRREPEDEMQNSGQGKSEHIIAFINFNNLVLFGHVPEENNLGKNSNCFQIQGEGPSSISEPVVIQVRVHNSGHKKGGHHEHENSQLVRKTKHSEIVRSFAVSILVDDSAVENQDDNQHQSCNLTCLVEPVTSSIEREIT